MKKYLESIAAVICAAAMLCVFGCSEIDYDSAPLPAETSAASESVSGETEAATDEADASVPEETESSENKTKLFDISGEEFAAQLECEDEAEGFSEYNSLVGASGGYVEVASGTSFTINATVPSAQHYKISLCLCAVDSIVSLSVDGVELGAYYAEQAVSFRTFRLDGIYLTGGTHELMFSVLKGIAYADYITIENTGITAKKRYDVSISPINRNSSLKTSNTMQYLSEIFGEKTLTAQHVTINTNTEINAIYAETGRYPAIRCGDLSHYSGNYGGADKAQNAEIELCEDWAAKGGLNMLSWMWYAPLGKSEYFAEKTDFSLSEALTDIDVAKLNSEELDALLSEGKITEECRKLISDIDTVSEQLKILSDKDITVLWRPLAEAGTAKYWWGADGKEAYIKLWRLMVSRMDDYHGLTNLIWVCGGESYDYYPGNDYVDIIGEDVYSDTDRTATVRFVNTAYYGTNYKAAALTECSVLPDPDLLSRDNAMWLWFGIYRGDYIIDENGRLNGTYFTREQLDYAYNHELFVTLDELPNFVNYGLIEG